MTELFYDDEDIAALALWYIGSPDGVSVEDVGGGSFRIELPEDVEADFLLRDDWEGLAEHAQDLIDGAVSVEVETETAQIEEASEQARAEAAEAQALAISLQEQLSSSQASEASARDDVARLEGQLRAAMNGEEIPPTQTVIRADKYLLGGFVGLVLVNCLLWFFIA